MKLVSLDPRVGRMELADDAAPDSLIKELDHWPTYEVFAQKKRGDQHQHVGIVHAPNGEMALVLAKEQFARRGLCVNLWVVRTADVVATTYQDADIFDTTPQKTHREPVDYKVKDKINKYNQSKKEKNEQ